MKRLCCTILLLCLKLLSVTAERSVHILGENWDQLVTSSTLEWIPSSTNDEDILKHAVIASYQLIKEPNHEPGKDNTEDAENSLSSKPVYVCRAKINSLWVSGQLRPQKHVCIVSLYKQVSEYKQFEILINIEGSSRLSWVHKNKFTIISQGPVTSGIGDNNHKSFIARRAANNHDTEGSLTYYVGKFLPNENLGVFHFVDQNNDELQFEDGEILIETEPIGYEFRYIKFDKFRGRSSRKQIELGQATLKNQENGVQLAESVIGYKYKYYLLWGKGHGLLTGLPFTIFLPNGTQTQGQWAMPTEKPIADVAPVQRNLGGGTAVNVTLLGNYTELEIPYNATVICIYNDGEKRNITIRDTKREHNVLDIVALYSPTYFLSNNSHVPTTTTTTTTTTPTTSSTSKTTVTTQEATPIGSPDEHLSNEVDTEGTNTKGNGSMLSDDHVDRGAPSSMQKDGKDPNGVSSPNIFSSLTILIVSLAIRKVT